ncbi:MAG: methyltransferase domain-containing protein [Proteobacteria bacterium]|nr:MAG: methyltransferase domain-containing protein [Pseudomonadota bacterium]
MEQFSYSQRLIKQHFNRQASSLSTLDFLFRELAARVSSRLDYINLQPDVIIDCGSGLGFDHHELRSRYPMAKIYETDLSLGILKTQQTNTSWLGRVLRNQERRKLIVADAYELPFKHQFANLMYANLLLPYLADIPRYFKEVYRILSVGGSFCISGLGVDSFKELRELGLTTYRFPDMHDIGDMLIAAGFSNPVVDTEYITLDYDDIATLLADIRLVGCGAANDLSLRKSLSRKEFIAIKEKDQIPTKITLELFVAHGWKDQQQISLPEGYQPINFIRHK